MKRTSQHWPPANVRLVAEGTRVIVLKGAGPHPTGIITEVRTQTNLKPYVVICDDGAKIYASGHDLARADDGDIRPFTVRPKED